MRKSLGVAALAVLFVALLLAASFSTGSNTDVPGSTDTRSLSSNDQAPTSSPPVVNFSQARQFQAGAIFNNRSYSIGVDPLTQDFAVGDLNHDGLSDVAVISKQTNAIRIYNRSANGILSSHPWTWSRPDIVDLRSVAIGDMNRDGLSDLIVSYNDSVVNGRVAIFYQSSTYPYLNSTVKELNLGDLEPGKLVIGKFNGASNECIATVCMGSQTLADDSIVIWKYPFGSAVSDRYRISIPTFTKSKFLVAGEINGDGLEDLAIGNIGGSNVCIALQSATWGTWSLTQKTISGSASDLSLTDTDGDGRADLIFADASNAGGYSTVRIYPNNGSGFVNSPTHAPLKTPLGPGTVAVGSLSTSGPGADLIFLSSTYSNASAYYQNGQGFLGQYSNLTFPLDESPLKALVDNSITGHEGVFILCQGPSGSNGTITWFDVNPSLTGNADASVFSGSKPTTMATGEMADGSIVVAVTLTDSNKVLLYDEKTDRSWTVQSQAAPVAAVFGKFSSSEWDDLAVLNSGSHSISLYHCSELQTDYQPYKNMPLPFTGPLSLTANSLRGDGYDDLLVGYSQGCYVLYNSEDGHSFGSTNETLGGSTVGNRVSIVVSDFNGDGIGSDVAVLNTATNQVEIYLRNMTGVPGSFYHHAPSSFLSPIGVSDRMKSIALGDFDGSPGLDVAAITQNGKLLVFIQPSYGFIDTTFYPDLALHLGGNAASLSAGDVNDDGLTDVVVGYADSPRLAVFLRTASDKFANVLNFTAGAASAMVMAQDIDGDGRTDISCASPGSHSVSVWFQHNLAPVAGIAGPPEQFKGVNAGFSGASSQDSFSDMGSLNYTWTFGDGSTGYGRTASHQFANNITYNIILRVTDRAGLYSTATTKMTVLQTFPSADLTIWSRSSSEGSWMCFNDTSRPSDISHSALQSWQWEFDGTVGNDTQNAKQHFGAGEHTVRLTIEDVDGVSNSTALRFFNVTEVSPMAGFRSGSARVGSLVYFNSTSEFAWTPIVTYRWDFGDGTAINGTSQEVNHTFALKGWYEITLNVTDGQGRSNEYEQWLYVEPTPPTASLDLNGPSVEGTITNFSVSTHSFNQIVSWNWSYDNNRTWRLSNDAVTGSSFIFTKNGTYWVALNVTEKDGSWCLVGRSVEVKDTGPVIQGFWAPAGLTCEMDQNVSLWASALSSYEPITRYEWNFDYGSGGTWIASTPLLTNHTSWCFSKPGIHYLKVRVWDDDGYSEYPSWLEIQVNNLAPVAHFSYQNSTQTSGQVLFDATLSTDTPSDIASLTYAWNFGDQGGWTSPSTVNRTVSHVFERDGRYNVTILVRDRWGSGSALVQAIVLVDRTPPAVVMESTGSNASAGQSIMVSVKVTDLFGVKKVVLEYRLNDGSWASLPMTPMNEPDTFYGQIPSQSPNTNVSYLIVATDSNNNSYSTQTYQLNIKAAPSLSVSDDYLTLLAIGAIVAAVLIMLLYRALVPVDEVFIIFQDGQLMAHQTRRIKPGMDDDILASMFVAIQMFVKDSFKDESSTGLNRLDFGKKKILIERGESFYLAVVLHSNRTGSVPKRMQSVINDIQMNFGPVLKGWDGDLEKVRGVKDSVNSLVNHKKPFGNR